MGLKTNINKRNLPTLEDVALDANVSTATVSRCLNEPDKVSIDTRERVLEAVKRLQYAPNFGARAIAANRTGIFGAVIPTMENAIFARGIEAFQKTLVASNKTMFVASSAYDRDLEELQIRTMVARGADGILLIGTERNADIYDFLKERNIPTVVAWARSTNKDQSFVGFDNFNAARQLMTKALELGHQSFGFISAHTKMNDRARERVLGATAALQDIGIDPTSMPVIETEYSIDCGREACRKFIIGKRRPTLIMCGNDVLAVGAIQEAQDAGLNIPQDISITGFDDIEIAKVISPGLTTVHVPHGEMGQKAAETLLSLVEDSSRATQLTLDTHIVERKSLGPTSF